MEGGTATQQAGSSDCSRMQLGKSMHLGSSGGREWRRGASPLDARHASRLQHVEADHGVVVPAAAARQGVRTPAFECHLHSPILPGRLAGRECPTHTRRVNREGGTQLQCSAKRIHEKHPQARGEQSCLQSDSQDDGVVALDEAHASHVCRQVEHVVAALHHLVAVVRHAQVNQDELIAEHILLRGGEAGKGKVRRTAEGMRVGRQGKGEKVSGRNERRRVRGRLVEQSRGYGGGGKQVQVSLQVARSAEVHTLLQLTSQQPFKPAPRYSRGYESEDECKSARAKVR